MNKKILPVIAVSACIVFLGASTAFFLKKGNNADVKPATDTKKEVSIETTTETKNIVEKDLKTKETADKKSVEKEEKQTIKSDEPLRTYNLFNDIPSSALPLSAIAEIANLPTNVQDKIIKIAETNNIYMVQKHNNKLFVITENPLNIRHNVEFTEIDIHNGHQHHTALSYKDKIKDSDNDIWEYSEETKQPLRHTIYNENGDMEFVETWNYDSEEPVKYVMKNSEGKVLTMRKETLQNGTDLRIENLVYDTDGNTKLNVSVTYDGQDLKRFTYYNADKIGESASIYSDYNDGQKIKEVLYTSDLKVKNSYTSEYKDGIREEITKWDNANKEVEKYIQIDSL